jgi:hypothetical protein
MTSRNQGNVVFGLGVEGELAAGRYTFWLALRVFRRGLCVRPGITGDGS